MLITPIITINSLTNESYNRLLKDIDKGICYITENQFKNDIYGSKLYVNLNLFDLLKNYKDILLSKLLGCNCLDDENILFITSRIQQLLNE